MPALTVHEDSVTGVWTFDLDDHRIEIEPRHGFLKIDGCLHHTTALQGLDTVTDLAGAPLDTIRQLIGQRTAPLTKEMAPPSTPPRRLRTATHRSVARTTPSKPEPAPAKPVAALNTTAAAAFLGLSPKTLETQRTRGGGPPFIKLGSRVVYRQQDLETWLAARRRRSTSDPGHPAKGS